MQNKFFGSKLNSFLLLILIILMVIAIRIMLRNEKEYFGMFQKEVPVNIIDKTQEPIPKENLLGKKEDLISFSIWPNTKVHGIVSYRGVIKGGYFFEGNIGINILDMNKNRLKASNAVATTDWMTGGPVTFEGNIDFTGLPKGEAFFEIKQDDPRDASERGDSVVKSILIPIIIE